MTDTGGLMPQRIAIAGDWHGNVDFAQAAIKEAADLGAELILHAGDFGYWPALITTPISGNRFAAFRDPRNWAFGDAVDLALAKHNLCLWFVDGNHEVHDQLLAQPVNPDTGRRPLRERIDHLPRGYRWTWGGNSWLALGGAASVDRHWRRPGRDWWPEEYVTATDVNTAIAGGSADVMLCHDGPWSTPHLMDRYSEANGWPVDGVARSNQNRRLIEQVMTGTGASVLFHGRYHDRYTDTFDLNGVERTVIGLDSDDGALSDNLILVAPDGRPTKL